jgi:hypothetical protein
VSVAHYQWGTTMRQDYTVGTYLLGVGTALVALSRPAWKAVPMVSALGPLVLGAYACHMLYIKLLWPIDAAANGQPLIDVLHWLAVFILAFATSALLARWRWTRPLVA